MPPGFWRSLSATPWLFADRPYRIPVTIEASQPNLPISAVFAPELPFDPDSIIVSRGSTEVAAQISESLESGCPGTISWLAAKPDEYFIYFDTPRPKKRPSRDRREPTGGGDACIAPHG